MLRLLVRGGPWLLNRLIRIVFPKTGRVSIDG